MMKGFELHYNQEIFRFAVQDGITHIYIYCVNGQNIIKGIAIDHRTRKKICWLDEGFKVGDVVRIRFCDIEICSKELHTSEIEKSREDMKLETYLQLKDKLTKKGLI